jgi:amidophosphoribosyltransferase
MGLVRSPYVGRTFIEPEQSIRHFGVRLKHNAVADVLRGKRVVVVDDRIVRGTTSRKIVKMLRGAGASEVHFRISSPQFSWPCYYGIDTPTRSELIAPSHTTEEISQYLTSDSLSYLPLDSTIEAVTASRVRQPVGRSGAANGLANGDGAAMSESSPAPRNCLPVVREEAPDGTGGFCHACFSGEYPVKFRGSSRPRQMRLLDF